MVDGVKFTKELATVEEGRLPFAMTRRRRACSMRSKCRRRGGDTSFCSMTAAWAQLPDRLHQWRVGDLVLWDNRCTMHRRDAFDPTADA